MLSKTIYLNNLYMDFSVSKIFMPTRCFPSIISVMLLLRCTFHCDYVQILLSFQASYLCWFTFCAGKLTLNFGAPYAMKDAIKFLYTGEVNVTLERVQDLLEVADYLQIAEMTEVCVRYLKGVTITLDNCVRVSV